MRATLSTLQVKDGIVFSNNSVLLTENEAEVKQKVDEVDDLKHTALEIFLYFPELSVFRRNRYYALCVSKVFKEVRLDYCCKF